jgi:hypothetical protein
LESTEDVNDELRKPTGELVFFRWSKPIKTKDNQAGLQFDMYASFPVSREDVYIDAVTGEVLLLMLIKHLGEYSHGRQTILLKSNCKNLPQ